jgi:hypothetical protein
MPDEDDASAQEQAPKRKPTKAAEAKQVVDAFWTGFEEYMKMKQKEAARRHGGWALQVSSLFLTISS